jgi:hypothetical protein
VGSPLIRSTKTGEPVNHGEAPPAAAAKELNRTMTELVRQKVPAEAIDRHGKIIYWKWPEDARLADLFQGDEVGNAAHLDLGKVQMFFFTLILVFTYAVILGRMFLNVSPAITEFPPVDQGMVALLGISHAGFLSNNAVPHSVSEDIHRAARLMTARWKFWTLTASHREQARQRIDVSPRSRKEREGKRQRMASSTR